MNDKLTCSRRLEWDSLHRVPGHSGACQAFHGHRYKAIVQCSGDPDEAGMIIDFGVIKEVIGSWIDDKWDHSAILWKNDNDPAVELIEKSNDKYGNPVYFMDKPPTAEYIAEELAHVSIDLLSEYDIVVNEIKIWETPNCSASWNR
jgi:6-pyruvoyltetrahydropterin/6-carboxytetrahydropterin synthase